MPGTKPQDRPRHFSLFTSDRLPRLLARHRDSGLSLDGETLRWWVEGGDRRARLDDIVAIRLATSLGGYASATGVCEITFRRFDRLLVFSGTAFGNTDAARNAEYRTFVQALHRALPPEVRRSATFSAGHRRAELPAVRWALSALIAFIAILAVVVALNASGPRAIFLPALLGGFMIWPLARLLREGKDGGTYHPDHIPHALLP